MTTSDPKAMFASVAEIERQRAKTGKAYQEFLRVPAMSAGLYVLAAGASDHQKAHHEDEMYYVLRGRARFHIDESADATASRLIDGGRNGVASKQDREVSAGSVIFVAAEVEHRFYDIEEELAVLVFFAPAES